MPNLSGDQLRFFDDLCGVAGDLGAEFEGLDRPDSAEKARALAEALVFLRECIERGEFPEFPRPVPRLPVITHLCQDVVRSS